MAYLNRVKCRRINNFLEWREEKRKNREDREGEGDEKEEKKYEAPKKYFAVLPKASRDTNDYRVPGCKCGIWASIISRENVII